MGFELMFREKLDEAAAEFGLSLPALEAPKDVQERVAEAQLPPGYIVQQAWPRVQQAIGGADGSHELSIGDRRLLGRLRVLREDAVHSPEPSITATDALRYRDLAEGLVRRIEGRADDQAQPPV